MFIINDIFDNLNGELLLCNFNDCIFETLVNLLNISINLFFNKLFI